MPWTTPSSRRRRTRRHRRTGRGHPTQPGRSSDEGGCSRAHRRPPFLVLRSCAIACGAAQCRSGRTPVTNGPNALRHPPRAPSTRDPVDQPGPGVPGGAGRPRPERVGDAGEAVDGEPLHHEERDGAHQHAELARRAEDPERDDERRRTGRRVRDPCPHHDAAREAERQRGGADPAQATPSTSAGACVGEPEHDQGEVAGRERRSGGRPGCCAATPPPAAACRRAGTRSVRATGR